MVLKFGGKFLFLCYELSLLFKLFFFNLGNNKLLNWNDLLYKAIGIKNALAKMI